MTIVEHILFKCNTSCNINNSIFILVNSYFNSINYSNNLDNFPNINYRNFFNNNYFQIQSTYKSCIVIPI